MSGQSTTIKLLGYLIVLNAILLAGYLFLIYTVQAKNKHVSELTNMLILEHRRAVNLDSINDLLVSIASERDAINAQFISSEEAVDLIERIEGITETYNIPIKLDINIADGEAIKGVKDTAYKTLDFEIHMRGTWNQVRDVITHINVLPHLIRTNHMELKVAESADGRMWDGGIRMRAYLFDSAEKK